MFAFTLFALGFAHLALAKTVHYRWDITWVRAAPDGFERSVIGINGQWPCPQIDVDLGDKVVVHMHNALGNQSTSLHWHGLHQNGTQEMDGASGVTQCPVAPGHSFTYEFMADQPGTYWYHSHTMGQYPDGLFGPLIIHDPNPPFHFDEELTFTLMDWYHEQMPDLIHAYQSRQGIAADGTPTPSGGALINLGKDVKIHVKPNTTYYIHIICPGNYPGHAWLFEDHPMTTVEIDGVYVEPVNVNVGGQQTRIAPGQRQGVLITTKSTTDKNYAIFDTMDVNMLFINKGVEPPANYNPNATAWLVYNDEAPLPPPRDVQNLDNEFFFNDLDYIPLDHEPLLGPVDHQIILETAAANISGVSRFTVNGETYLSQKVPTLYSALTLPDKYISNPIVYGQVNPIIVKHNEIVEIVINNRNSNLHPWHMHGRQFQVIERTAPNTGPWPGTYGNHSATPVKRDTFMLQKNAYGIIRFRADNPDKSPPPLPLFPYSISLLNLLPSPHLPSQSHADTHKRIWSIHCHIEFHTVSGFIATIIEAPEKLAERAHARRPRRDRRRLLSGLPGSPGGHSGGLPGSLPGGLPGGLRGGLPGYLPSDHLAACKSYPMLTEGNAAGNTRNPLDLRGANTKVNANDHGAVYPPPPPIYKV